MAARFHDGARRSRLPDREAARHRRGLDGRRAGVSRISLPPPLPTLAFAIAPFGCGCLCSSSFSAWGVTGISFGILLVFCWSRWYELVRVGTRWSSLVFPEIHQWIRISAPSSAIPPRYRQPENISDVRHPAARRAGEAPTMGPSDWGAGDRRWGNDGAARRCPATFQPVSSHAARARKKLPSLNRQNDHAALIRLGLPEPPTPGGDFVGQSALAPLRGLPSRYRGGSNIRRPSWVRGDR